MARTVTPARKAALTAAAWTIGLAIFFPILWTILTSFKTEAEAIASPPSFVLFDWTLENYAIVQERSNYFRQRLIPLLPVRLDIDLRNATVSAGGLRKSQRSPCLIRAFQQREGAQHHALPEPRG